jgi:hypothetical protein
MSRMHYAGIENGRTATSILEVDRVAAVLGLSASMRLYREGTASVMPRMRGG